MVIEIIISEFDFKVIRKLREKRILTDLTQEDLSAKVGVSESFFGNIENPKQPQKLNMRMFARVAKALEIKSYSELLPEEIVTNDLVKIRLKLLKINKRKEKDENGKPVKNMEIISIKAMSGKEISEYTGSNEKNKFLRIISKH